jgi:hypothetical protein
MGGREDGAADNRPPMSDANPIPDEPVSYAIPSANALYAILTPPMLSLQQTRLVQRVRLEDAFQHLVQFGLGFDGLDFCYHRFR